MIVKLFIAMRGLHISHESAPDKLETCLRQTTRKSTAGKTMREKGREGEGETTLLGLRVRTRILTLGFKRVDEALRKQQAINPNRFISIYSTCLLYIWYIYVIRISGNLRYLINNGMQA